MWSYILIFSSKRPASSFCSLGYVLQNLQSAIRVAFDVFDGGEHAVCVEIAGINLDCLFSRRSCPVWIFKFKENDRFQRKNICVLRRELDRLVGYLESCVESAAQEIQPDEVYSGAEIFWIKFGDGPQIAGERLQVPAMLVDLC